MDATTIAVITLGLLVFIAHGLEDVFARTRIPDVLILLFIGLLLGPIAGLVTPEHMGKVGPVFTTLTLIVILFEGGLGLDLKVLGKSLAGATGLTIWSFLATLAVVAPLAHLFLGFNWLQAFVLAAAVGGTSTALVIPLVRRLALSEKTKTMLTLESAISDVLTIVVVLALVSAMYGGELKVGQIFGGIFTSFVFAAFIGCLAGAFWSLALHWLHGLKKSIFTTPAFVLVVYGIVEFLGFRGAIAALMMGITLGNIKSLPPNILGSRRELLTSPTKTELAVFEEIAFLLKTFFFVYVGISIMLSWHLIWAGLGITVALFLLRIPVIHASFIPGSSFSRFEATTAGALNPKGLAAAVAASIPLQYGLEKGLELHMLEKETELKMVVFAIIMLSTLAASTLIFLIERGWFNVIGKILYGRYMSRPITEAEPVLTLNENRDEPYMRPPKRRE
ncbi:MAG: cation:proton antiporter [Holophagales bacterium]|jgi:NhaP-type Na+/H+ or K+/H+ antiporter|nr:cation:proton antiporter [Holophagales bacterium]